MPEEFYTVFGINRRRNGFYIISKDDEADSILFYKHVLKQKNIS